MCYRQLPTPRDYISAINFITTIQILSKGGNKLAVLFSTKRGLRHVGVVVCGQVATTCGLIEVQRKQVVG